ncbi:MAG: Rrf2 family transcriptional regulator [Nanoarchaeota archaeon]|nr:Rrf2 family transcriptional regulator [Nanoarchaeota archaeon]MBU1975302.1 Rrf2 family transcriptional regulator [Nanoarchaeota archaeon]
MKTSKIFNVFLREKPALMLVSLLNKNQDMYASSLAKKVDCTYSHVVKILQEMQRANLIGFEKQGRLKVLTLTKKGEDVAKNIDNIRMNI